MGVTPVLELRDVHYSYPRSKQPDALLRNINAVITAGECVGFVGPNGSGKSTLLKIIATLLRPTRGEILYRGSPVTSCMSRFRSVINYSAGAPLGFYPRLTAAENLRFFSGLKGRMLSKAEIRQVLEVVGLDASVNIKYAYLSLGMRQRLHLARLTLEPAEFWIVDEPTNGLDTEGVKLLERLLKDAETKVRLIVSHDMDFLIRVTDRRLEFREGGVVCEDSFSS